MQINLNDQARDNLRFIRGAMERAGRASAVSGLGGVLMGLVALAAMALASFETGAHERLSIWIGAAVIAVTAGAGASWIKARQSGLTLLGDPGRRFLTCLVPALLVGAVLTAALWSTPQVGLLPGLWMMLYGAGVLAAGTYAMAPVVYMGGCFLVAGLFSLALPEGFGNPLLGITFGGLHIVFGYRVYRDYGG